MKFWEYKYLELLDHIVANGEQREDRTGVGTYSIFGAMLDIPINVHAFPVMTTKKIYWKGVVTELLWFLQGGTNIGYLQAHGVRIWDEWADENGDLGPVYGKQWRDWNGVDQIDQLVNSIRKNPTSRRHILSAWNVGELSEMALPPCHMTSQFYVREGRFLDCQLYQRSADMFLGVPFNIASYSLLTTMLAYSAGLTPGNLRCVYGDAHVYTNHLEQVKKQTSRTPRRAPTLNMDLEASAHALKGWPVTPDRIRLLDYDPLPSILAPIAV